MPYSLAEASKAAGTKTEQGEALEAKGEDLRDMVTVPRTQLDDTQQEQDYWREQVLHFASNLMHGQCPYNLIDAFRQPSFLGAICA